MVREKQKWERVKLGEVCSINAPMVDPRNEQYAFLPHIGNESIDGGQPVRHPRGKVLLQ